MNTITKMSLVFRGTPGLIIPAWCYASLLFPAVRGSGTDMFVSSSWEPLSAQDCPKKCDLLFGRLESGTDEGGQFQVVGVQERGEPKSGTTFMYEWGAVALNKSCVYLQRLYGLETCRMENSHGKHTLLFEPGLARGHDSAPCVCDTVKK